MKYDADRFVGKTAEEIRVMQQQERDAMVENNLAIVAGLRALASTIEAQPGLFVLNQHLSVGTALLDMSDHDARLYCRLLADRLGAPMRDDPMHGCAVDISFGAVTFSISRVYEYVMEAYHAGIVAARPVEKAKLAELMANMNVDGDSDEHESATDA
jgi:hypothetical protein